MPATLDNEPKANNRSPGIFTTPNAPGQGEEGRLLDTTAANIALRSSLAVNRQQPFAAPLQMSTSVTAFNTTFQRVLDLLEEDNDEVQGTAQPSLFALRTALELLSGAFHLMDLPFPKGGVASDGKGGLHVYWKAGARKTQLAIPGTPNGAIYIYHQDGPESVIEQEVSTSTLAFWLDWLP